MTKKKVPNKRSKNNITQKTTKRTRKKEKKLKNIVGGDPIHSAAYNGDYEVVKNLQEERVDVNILDENTGSTPLHNAVVSLDVSNTKIVELLLEKNANVNITNNNGLSPLHLAVKKEKDPKAKVIIKISPP